MKIFFASLFFIIYFFFLSFVTPEIAQAATACDADINGDHLVDISDYGIMVSHFFETGSNIPGDVDRDGIVDVSDYGVMVNFFFLTCSPSPTATSTPAGPTATPAPSAQSNTWYQDGGNPQRTGYTTYDPGSSSNWQFVWSWNGPDSNGGTGNHFYDAGRSSTRSVVWEGRTVLGNGSVFVPALSHGVYALNKDSGAQQWNFSDNTSFQSTPSYDPLTNSVFVGATNRKVYKLNASNGALVASFTTGSSIKKSVLVAGNAVFVVTDAGDLYKLNTSNLSQVWRYQGASKATTPPSYSSNHDLVVFTTSNLNVHAVKNTDGTQKWKVKPTQHDPSDRYTFEGYWPVIAEQHGLILVRMNIGMPGLWSGPGVGHRWPDTMNEIRQYLINNPQYQNLFALDLETGTTRFVPAVGPGGVEGLLNNSAELWNGSVPVVKVTSDGKEVAYEIFRSGQGVSTDGRWDSHIGEMVLDDSTISGLKAGDLRFIDLYPSMSRISDEQTPLSMSANMLFYAHWGASEAHQILDRSSSKGLTDSNPITADMQATVIRRMEACGTKNVATRKSDCGGLTLYDDGRYWGGPGWWTYWNVLDPPTPHRNAYSEGLLPRYTYASDGVMVVEGNGGELMVFKTQ